MSVRLFLLNPNISILTFCRGDLPTLKVGYKALPLLCCCLFLLSDLLVFA